MYLCKSLDGYGFPSSYSVLSKQDVFNFLKNIDLSKNGSLLKEKTFRILFPELYSELVIFVSNHNIMNDWKFNRKLFHFLQDDVDLKLGLCTVCGEKYTRFESFNYGYHMYCSMKCTGKSLDRLEKIKCTNLERFGYDNAVKSPEIRTKIKNTNLEKYGVEYPLQSSEIKVKWKSTNLEKYGCDYSISSDEVREKVKQTNLEKYGCENVFQSDIIKEKIKDTNNEKYYVDNPLQSSDIKEKWKTTNLERYGCEYSINSQFCQDKVKTTNFERYGCENVFQSDIIKKKIKQTNLEKYGVENYAQTNEFTKYHRKQIEYDDLTFDSSWEVIVYQYCKENNIPCEYQPDITFEYEYGGKEHYYHPDFLINGKLYEVKGDHFFDGDKMICPFDRSKDELFEAKYQCMLHNSVIFIRNNEIEKIKNNINIF